VAEDIQQLSCTSGAFCAVRGDGHVVTWIFLRSEPPLEIVNLYLDWMFTELSDLVDGFAMISPNSTVFLKQWILCKCMTP